jgi:hypothetical protein
MPDIIRIIRVLEYTGEREALETHLRQRFVKGWQQANAGIVIREAMVGDFPEVVSAPVPAAAPEPSQHIARDGIEAQYGLNDTWPGDEI